MNMNYQELCNTTMEIVKECATYIAEQHHNRDSWTVEAKGKHDFVTQVDKNAEKQLIDRLSKLLPEAGFIAEEGTATGRGEKHNWVIDPLDGTTNFIHGVFPFAISVALLEDDQPVVGVVHEIGLDETFYSWKDGGAWLNGNPIRTSGAGKLADALIATGFPYTNFERIDRFMDSLTWFMRHSHGLRRLGSAATDIAYVACGRYDGFYEYGLHPWDVAAGILILREAGGAVNDFNGGEDFLFNEEIVCSNGTLHEEFVKTVKQLMVKE